MNEEYLLIQSIKDYAIFMLNTEGIISSWNEGAKRIKGYSADEIIGKHFSIFYTKEDLDDKKPERELKIAIATGKYEEEGWRLRKDGSMFWANVVITAVYNQKGHHIGFSKITRDLTERKNSEEQLRRSEERYRLLVEQVKDYGIFMLDKTGHISSWNEGAARINGYSTGEVLGKHFSVFYPAEDIASKKPERELEIAAKEGKYEEEGWRIRKDGTRYWVGVVITAIFNAANKLIGFAKVTRDLTERKKAENELKESNERYRLLAEEVNKTNIQLSEVNNQLEQFASIASHDLKEPLRKIATFTDMVMADKQNKFSKDTEKNLARIIDASRRMRAMIDDILAYSSLAQKEEPECISLQKILNDTTELLDQEIKEKKAIIHSDRLPVANVIPSQFGQLFQNLISNSLKFSKKNVSPQIDITHRFLNSKQVNGIANNSSTKYLQLQFRDNGIGFEQKDAEKIFDLFKRLHTRQEYSGTGIGLAIVKKVVENHNGFISAEGEEEKGASFKIILPVN
jgi:PAS domain S-box-containing protein